MGFILCILSIFHRPLLWLKPFITTASVLFANPAAILEGVFYSPNRFMSINKFAGVSEDLYFPFILYLSPSRLVCCIGQSYDYTIFVTGRVFNIRTLRPFWKVFVYSSCRFMFKDNVSSIVSCHNRLLFVFCINVSPFNFVCNNARGILHSPERCGQDNL